VLTRSLCFSLSSSPCSLANVYFLLSAAATGAAAAAGAAVAAAAGVAAAAVGPVPLHLLVEACNTVGYI